MLKEIYNKRYGKILIAIGLLIVAIYGLTSWSSQKKWHNAYHYYHSDEFEKEYDLYPEDSLHYYQGNGEFISYDSRQDYIDAQLMVFRQPDERDSIPFILSPLAQRY